MWVRNAWGLGVLLAEGIVLMLLGWKLPAHFLDTLYSFLGATCCLNAVESLHGLFAAEEYYVGGEIVTTSDAHTVAEKWGMDYRFWAILWLSMSIALTVLSIFFAFNAKENRWFKGKNQQQQQNNTNSLNQEILEAQVTPVAYYTADGQRHYYTPPTGNAPAPSAPSGDNLTVPYSTAAVNNTSENQQQTAAETRKKRNWFGFMKRQKKSSYDAAVY
jgi:hypothetical protein